MMKQFFEFVKNTIPPKVILAFLLFFASWALYIGYDVQKPKNQEQIKELATFQVNAIPENNSLSLVTMPDDGIVAVEDIIDNSKKSLDIVIYQLRDERITQKLVEAQQRGVAVRVIMEKLNFLGESLNDQTYNFLKANNVPVKWAEEYFALTHQKTIIADQELALIMTFNLSSRYYASGRDFGVINRDPEDVRTISEVFDADWQGKEIVAENRKDLVWSPGASETMFAFIDSDKKSLDVYCQLMDDERIVEKLIEAAQRGVAVRVNMTYQTDWKAPLSKLVDEGVQVKTYSSSAKRYIHAKVMIADESRAILSSQNFSFNSLELNRELGILISKPEIISSISNTFNGDWAESRVFKSVNQLKDGPIKMSSSGICHTPESASYAQIKNFTAFENVQNCIDEGGRLLGE